MQLIHIRIDRPLYPLSVSLCLEPQPKTMNARDNLLRLSMKLTLWSSSTLSFQLLKFAFRQFFAVLLRQIKKKWFIVDIIWRLRAMNGRIEIEIEIERKLSCLAKANNWETCSFVQLAQRVCVCRLLCVTTWTCIASPPTKYIFSLYHSSSSVSTELPNWKRTQK